MSCAARERLRTVRPEATSGSTTAGMMTKTKAESLADVANISASDPTKRKRLRSSTEAEAPKVDFSWVVSAVSREISSPTRALS